MSNELAAYQQLTIPGILTATSLTLPDDLSREQWEQVGETLALAHRASAWWIGDWLRYGHSHGYIARDRYDEAERIVQRLKRSTLWNCAWVAGVIESSRRREDLQFEHHKEVASLPPADQDAWLDRAENEHWTREQLRHALREARRPQLGDVPPPTGSYEVLYADPPWRYEHQPGDSRAIENHYPTTNLVELKELRVPAAEVAVLFMWATSPKLNEALELMGAWGFLYRTNLVWVKDKIGLGYYVRQRHELLLIGRRGDAPIPRAGTQPDSVIEAPRLEHSAKPSVVYELIEQMYPAAAKVELFARQPRDGWEVWGDEVAA